jgi:MurNAc alpha-1-phosphate uridylyltransferase
MILAAGRGTRMRPISDTVPKPLLELAGVERIIVNAHYRAEMIAAHLAGRAEPRIEISREEEPLETGGGVLRALPSLGEYFFVVNADVFWLDSRDYALSRLAGAFDPARMDAVMLLQQTVTAVGYDGRGDYFLDRLGNPRRRREREVAPYLFTGIQLLHRRAFDGAAETKFSLNLVYDKAERAGRLHAIVHDGEWFHVGTPDGLAATRARLAYRRTEW